MFLSAVLCTVAFAASPEVASLHAEAAEHYSAGRVQEALEASERAVQIEVTTETLDVVMRYQYELRNLDVAAELAEQIANMYAEDPDSALERAAALSMLVVIEIERGAFEGARRHAKTAFSLVCETGEDPNPAGAQVAHEVGILIHQLGGNRDAQQCVEVSVAMREAAQGPDAVELADGLNFLGTLVRGEDLPAARAHYERALEIADAADPKSRLVAEISANIGVVFQDSGEHRRAEKAYRRALEIFVEAEAIMRTASTLNSLAHLARIRGRTATSLELYEQALQGFVVAQGEEGRDVALVHTNLGSVLIERGDMVRARLHLERALEILLVLVGHDHDHVASARGNLASLLSDLGDHEAARRHFEAVLQIRVKTAGEEHPQTAHAQANLAVSRLREKRVDEAEVLLTKAIEHADEKGLASMLNNLGGLHMERGTADVALVYFERAVDLEMERFGRDHPEVFKSQMNLAGALRDVDRIEESLALLTDVLERARAMFGKGDPALLNYLEALAEAQLAAGDTDAVRAVSARALNIATRTINELIPELGEREALAFSAKRRGFLHRYLKAHDRPEDTVAAYEAMVRWKGGVAAALTNRQRAMSAGALPRSAQTAMELIAVRQKIAALTLAPILPTTAGERSADLAKLSERRGLLERRLASLSQQFRAQQRAASGNVQSLCKAMSEGSTLVDYLRIEGDEPGYLAFVVRQETCDVQRFDLGPASVVDDAALGHREVLGVAGAQASRIDERGRRLAELIWEPLQVTDEVVTIVADAAIAGVSFAALPVGDGYLVEHYEVAYRESASEVMRRGSSKVDEGVLFIGALDYGEPTGVAGPCVNGDFADLPATGTEVSSLMEIWGKRSRDPARVIDGDLASEADVLKAMRDKKVVHFATHGLFATDRCQSALIADGVGYDPMVLSGIVLSGVNDKLGSISGEDGILTAAEVSTMRLRGTSLVVLSGCETGMGEAVSGEGVLGLRRAFAASGARALVMSLWAIPDEATAILMADFYKYLLKGRRGPAEALRKAQLERLKVNRKTLGTGQPSDWAAFIASGRSRESIE